MNILDIRRTMKLMKYISALLVMCLHVVVANQAYAAENITFYHYDLLGSPVVTTNEVGDVIWREEYSPYGDKLLNQDANSDNVRGYTGHVHDAETGLTYMQTRYYDPEIGRFMGMDPVGFKSKNPISFNRYAYANNNPYKYTDPNGEFAQSVYGGIAGAIGGFVASGKGFANTAVGTIVGAIVGAAVGTVAPQSSNAVGMAVVGMLASSLGQTLGSTTTAAIEKGPLNISLKDAKVDAYTTISAGLGTSVGGLVSKGIAKSTMRSVIGPPLNQAGAPTALGITAGAVVEGTLVGTAENLAPEIENSVNEVMNGIESIADSVSGGN